MEYYISVRDASEILDIAYRTVLSWIAAGRFGNVKVTVAKRYRLNWDNIKYFCENNGHPLPEKIPKHKRERKVEWVYVDSEEGKALLE